ncbi:hypothetical protein E6B08_18730 [Pseudomonas putida]|uniref:Uncharacterized protein n=1 Tax=Pseudomonas putida TaxID=303 RepID=A0A4D6XFG2_PSEPU|nr:hypothetical protein E6B08_18730 [Pseudomonas putida]
MKSHLRMAFCVVGRLCTGLQSSGIRMPAIFDDRNIYDPFELSTLGYLYHGIGRPRAGHCKVTAA